MPTSRPASTSAPQPTSIRVLGKGPAKRDAAGAASSPRMQARRHALSPFAGCRRPQRMPLMPATRPLCSTNMAAEMPMRTPPVSADPGVKEFQSMLIGSFLRAVHAIEDFQDPHHVGVGDAVEDAL